MKNTLLLISIIFNVILIAGIIWYAFNRGGMYKVMRWNKGNQKDINTSYIHKKDIFNKMPDSPNKIVFVGNSLIEFCDWSGLFDNKDIINRGISGDDTDGLISRLDDILRSNPDKIFIMIGINDLGMGKSSDHVISNYKRIVHQIKSGSPETRIYFHSLLPANNQGNRKTSMITGINDALREMATSKGFTYIDLFDQFKDENGLLKQNLTFDGLHLNGDGYLLWKELIQGYVNE